ncbi:hypothetical protein D9M69_734700 [compost metagenome]
MPAQQRPHPVGDLRLFARAQVDPLRQMLERHAGGHMVEYLQRQGLGIGVVQA